MYSDVVGISMAEVEREPSVPLICTLVLEQHELLLTIT